jgi:hypothetical protein
MTPRTKVAGSDFGPDWNGQRCGAHARTTGQPCRPPAVTGSRRCRMHGGKGSGAPSGERNGNYRTGQYTKEMIEVRQRGNRAWRWIVGWRKENDFSDEEWLDRERKEVTVILGNDRFRRDD